MALHGTQQVGKPGGLRAYKAYHNYCTAQSRRRKDSTMQTGNKVQYHSTEVIQNRSKWYGCIRYCTVELPVPYNTLQNRTVHKKKDEAAARRLQLG